MLDSGTTTPAEQNPTFVSTIRVKLSKGRTAILKLESNKPLIVDPDGKLVNTHDHHSTNGPSSQEGNKIDAITLHPTMNLWDGQRMDPHLAYIIDLKTRKLLKPNLKQIKNPALKKWLRHYDQYFSHDEILYRAPDHKSNSHLQHVILIPSALQDQVLKSLHDGPLGGHLGITRTEERVRKRFHWPGIRKTVTRHIQLCNVCNHKNSPTNRNTAPLGHISVIQPFTFWTMDYMGPLSETSRGNKHILVV